MDIAAYVLLGICVAGCIALFIKILRDSRKSKDR